MDLVLAIVLSSYHKKPLDILCFLELEVIVQLVCSYYSAVDECCLDLKTRLR